MTSEYERQLQQAVDLIRHSKKITVFTGAGISTPSGISDFRSVDTGLWSKVDPMRVASLTVFDKNPRRFYEWFYPLARDIWKAQPNPAHQGLAVLESSGIIQSIITQNIDCLHQKAGSKKVIEVHGSVDNFICRKCRKSFPAGLFQAGYLDQQTLPVCRTCQSILKPDITLFEESLPQHAWDEAEQLSRSCDLMIVLGSSLSVYPAACLPEQVIKNNKSLILVNLSPTPLDPYAKITLVEDVARVIPDLVQFLTK